MSSKGSTRGKGKKSEGPTQDAVVSSSSSSARLADLSPELKIVEVLSEAQTSLASHRKLTKTLLQICKHTGPTFASKLAEQLKRICIGSKNETEVERILKLVNAFCQHEQAAGVAMELVQIFLTYCHAQDKHVRQHACELIYWLITALPSGDAEDDKLLTLLNGIVETMKFRSMDIEKKVRVAAVKAVWRLQNPEEEQDDVMQYLLLAMAEDNCQDVRKVILKHLDISASTLPHIRRMARDPHPDVRQIAYERLKTVSITVIPDAESCVRLLCDGLTDRSEAVRKAAQDTLCNGWLKALDYDVVKLLEHLDVETHGQELTQTIHKLLVHEELMALCPEKRTGFKIDFQQPIKSEAVLYWRIMCEKLRAEGKDEALESQLPTLSDFCEILSCLMSGRFKQIDADKPADAQAESTFVFEVSEHTDASFAATELLKMLPLFDMGDEVGRAKMLVLLSGNLQLILASKPSQYAEPIMNALQYMCQVSLDEYNKIVLKAITALREGALVTLRGFRKGETIQAEEEADDDHDVELADEEQNRLLLNLRREVKAKEAEKAELLKEGSDQDSLDKVTEALKAGHYRLYTYESIWLRCLHIVVAYLKGIKPGRADIPDFVARTVLAAIAGGLSNDVQELAILCLGLLCHLDLQSVPTHLPVIMKALEPCNVLYVREMAIKSVVDILLLWGPEKIRETMEKQQAGFQDSSEGVPCSQASFLQALPSQLLAFIAVDSREEVASRCLQSLSCEGAAKLLASNRWPQDPSIAVAQLLLNFWNPSMAKSLEEMMGDENSDSSSDEDEDEVIEHADRSMRQCLSVFFSAYSLASSKRQQIVADAVVLTLRHLLRGRYNIVNPSSISAAHRTLKADKFGKFLGKFIAYALGLLEYQMGLDYDASSLGDAAIPAIDPFAFHEQILWELAGEVMAEPHLTKALAPVLRKIKIHPQATLKTIKFVEGILEMISGESSQSSWKGAIVALKTQVHERLATLQKINEEKEEGASENNEATMDDETSEELPALSQNMDELIHGMLMSRREEITQTFGEAGSVMLGKKVGRATARDARVKQEATETPRRGKSRPQQAEKTETSGKGAPTPGRAKGGRGAGAPGEKVWKKVRSGGELVRDPKPDDDNLSGNGTRSMDLDASNDSCPRDSSKDPTPLVPRLMGLSGGAKPEPMSQPAPRTSLPPPPPPLLAQRPRNSMSPSPSPGDKRNSASTPKPVKVEGKENEDRRLSRSSTGTPPPPPGMVEQRRNSRGSVPSPELASKRKSQGSIPKANKRTKVSQ